MKWLPSYACSPIHILTTIDLGKMMHFWKTTATHIFFNVLPITSCCEPKRKCNSNALYIFLKAFSYTKNSKSTIPKTEALAPDVVSISTQWNRTLKTWIILTVLLVATLRSPEENYYTFWYLQICNQDTWWNCH